MEVVSYIMSGGREIMREISCVKCVSRPNFGMFTLERVKRVKRIIFVD